MSDLRSRPAALAARIERLRNVIAWLEHAPPSRQRDALLHAMRARVVTLDTGSSGSSAWRPRPDPLGSLARALG